MVTSVPTGPDAGLNDVMTGVAVAALPLIVIKNDAVAAIIRNARSCSCILKIAPFEKRLRSSGLECGRLK
jgi:hypothetical protein